jgi:hypothetical protein
MSPPSSSSSFKRFRMRLGDLLKARGDEFIAAIGRSSSAQQQSASEANPNELSGRLVRRLRHWRDKR